MRANEAASHIAPNLSGAVDIEIKKRQRESACAVSGVVAVAELSSEAVVLLTHRGRISLRGSSLVLVIYDSGTVEVKGKIEGVDLGYGKF